MIVECPNCSSTFNLPEELIPAEGRKVKCSVCENVFAVHPESSAAPEPEEFAETEVLEEEFDGQDDLGSVLDDAFSGDEDGGDEDGEEAPAGDGDGLGGMGFDLEAPAKRKKGKGGGKGKLIGIIVASVVLVAGLAAGGVYFMAPGLLGLAPMEEQAQGESASMADQIKNIYLEGIRQYYVENDKAGRVFVVEGKALNQFESPRELVEVEANLYDAQNNVLDTVRLMCGNTLSLFQLQVLARDEIEKALADEAGIGSNNINLQSGQHVPFMIVFFDPPDNVAEFNVSVVAARGVDL